MLHCVRVTMWLCDIATHHRPCPYLNSALRRWPWPLFKLLKGPVNIAHRDRAKIARDLLEAPNDSLEKTTLSIKTMCTDDLIYIANTGRLKTGSQIHALLSIIAINMRLDAGTLESLNSMIKSSMSLANNTTISLELLSSRVNARKTCTLLTKGATRVKDVLPILESLANSMPLYQGSEDRILGDTFRWTPPQPIADSVMNDPKVYEPGLQLSDQEKWGIRFHRKLMQMLKGARKSERVKCVSRFFQCIGIKPNASAASTTDKVVTDCFYIVAELTGRTCHLLELGTSHDENGTLALTLELSTSQAYGVLDFTTSLEAFAKYHDFLKRTKRSTVSVMLVDLLLEYPIGQENQIVFSCDRQIPMFDMYFRKPRENKPRDEAPVAEQAAIGDREEDSESDPGLEDALYDEIHIQEEMLLWQISISSRQSTRRSWWVSHDDSQCLCYVL